MLGAGFFMSRLNRLNIINEVSSKGSVNKGGWEAMVLSKILESHLCKRLSSY